ncbi:MAG: right-handed parallel beta-helix repeat-containing protein [Planctomycetes bacterium]|nr:right-handed parallel beta-helix repeat-containing protein [Planctomycetota bacterium]
MTTVTRRHAMLLVLALCGVSTPSVRADEGNGPPWDPSYKIKPHESGRLTAADVVGPDGIVYPDWRFAGVPGGIPEVPECARIDEFGGKADDGLDDSQALESGAQTVARRGGGALVLGAGTYHLDRPVMITEDNVVIRGQGPETTKIVFRYSVSEPGVAIFQPKDGATIGPDSLVEIHAAPDGLQRIALVVDGKVAAERKRQAHWGGTYLLRATGGAVLRAAKSGRHTLVGIAEWEDGRRREVTINVDVDPKHRRVSDGRRSPTEPKGDAAILFAGDQRSGRSWRLAEDGQRGDQQIVLQQATDLEPGDAIALEAPATERWNRLVRNACQWGIYRRSEFRVRRVDGCTIRLNQPLRIDFPVVDGSYAKQVFPIRRCGVEDLCLEQTQKLWTTGVLFANAWECWARGVKVIKAGRHPVYSRCGKWCEIRDCQFDGAWYVGGGGSAYVGWERSYDCLMENVTTWRMRHAPCVQWSSSGNVIRNSTFHGSDAQWHAGWTNENLYENCTVYAEGSHGTYGHGGWASPPEDKAHGPEGPRNVVYNCDFRAPKSGLWMGGMNENWLILHNRFIVDKGPGIYARTCSFDHIIRGNVFVLRRADQPAVMLASDDCTGIEISENRVFGKGATIIAGKAEPLVESDNEVVSDAASLPSDNDSPRPKPEVPSIFQWQRESLSPVEGAVTLDGRPLTGASIEFKPTRGPSSYGITDDKGQFELRFAGHQKGAPPDTYTVRISQLAGDSDERNEQADSPIVPPLFNAESVLRAEVTKGKNRFDFDLRTAP